CKAYPCSTGQGLSVLGSGFDEVELETYLFPFVLFSAQRVLGQRMRFEPFLRYAGLKALAFAGKRQGQGFEVLAPTQQDGSQAQAQQGAPVLLAGQLQFGPVQLAMVSQS